MKKTISIIYKKDCIAKYIFYSIKNKIQLRFIYMNEKYRCNFYKKHEKGIFIRTVYCPAIDLCPTGVETIFLPGSEKSQDKKNICLSSKPHIISQCEHLLGSNIIL